MNTSLSQWMDQFREKIPEKRIILVPSHVFFSQRIDKPEELEGEDLEQFVMLALEGMAPFPIEQLLYGYITFPGAGHVLLYATPKARLASLGIEDWENAFQLLPAFALQFSAAPDPRQSGFIGTRKDLALVQMESGSPIPLRIVARPLKGEAPVDDLRREQAEAILKSAKGLDRENLNEGILQIEEAVLTPQQAIVIGVRIIGRKHADERKEVSLPEVENGVWAMDIRDASIAQSEAADRRRGKLLWRVLLGMGGATAVLLFLQLTFFGISAYNAFQANRIAEMEDQVNRVLNKLTLAERLTQSTEADIQPYLLLGAINPYRPEAVYYTRVRARAFNEIEIEGESSSGINPVNAFADALTKLDFVASVENIPSTRRGETIFEMTIVFSDMPEEVELLEEPGEEVEESGNLAAADDPENVM